MKSYSYEYPKPLTQIYPSADAVKRALKVKVRNYQVVGGIYRLYPWVAVCPLCNWQDVFKTHRTAIFWVNNHLESPLHTRKMHGNG